MILGYTGTIKFCFFFLKILFLVSDVFVCFVCLFLFLNLSEN